MEPQTPESCPTEPPASNMPQNQGFPTLALTEPPLDPDDTQALPAIDSSDGEQPPIEVQADEAHPSDAFSNKHTKPVNIALAKPDNLMLVPGQMCACILRLTNMGNEGDVIKVDLEGVPPDWVRGLENPIRIGAGQCLPLPLRIFVPRQSDSRAQSYRVILRAYSEYEPRRSTHTEATWTVLPFALADLAVLPLQSQGRRGARHNLLLTNLGNAVIEFSLYAADEDGVLGFRFLLNERPIHMHRQAIQVEPGRVATVAMDVLPQRRWFGLSVIRPFTVTALSHTSEATQMRPGRYVHAAILSPSLLAILLALALSFVIAFAQIAPTRALVSSLTKLGQPSFLAVVSSKTAITRRFSRTDGIWNTTLGQLTLFETSTGIGGMYVLDHSSVPIAIQGNLRDRVLKGFETQNPANRFELLFDNDLAAFEGSWLGGDRTGQMWCGAHAGVWQNPTVEGCQTSGVR